MRGKCLFIILLQAMKSSHILLLLTFFISTALCLPAKAVDTAFQHSSKNVSTTATPTSDSPTQSDDDFAPGLFVFAVVGLACICAFTGVGIALTLIAFVLLSSFIAFGVISASIIVTLHQKSIEKGFKAFLVLGCLFTGLFSMAALFTVVNYITHWFTFLQALIAGTVTGLIAGFIMGQLLFVISRRLIIYLRKQVG